MLLSEVTGIPGAFPALKAVSDSPTPVGRDTFLAVAHAHGMDDPVAGSQILRERGLVREIGTDVFLTALGSRVLLLLEVVNGRNLADVLPLLRAATPSMGYEIVREGMTTRFVAELGERPDFGRLYVCSPWISFEPFVLRTLADAMARAEDRNGSRVQLLVITRPSLPGEEDVSGARQLEMLGAEVVFKRHLHSKLYIREPSPRGGVLGAVFGSQNLTRSKYLELGIYIRNDSEIIRQLISYFFDVYGLPAEM